MISIRLMNAGYVQSLMSTHFSLVMPRVTVPSSGNVESDIMQLFPADLWMSYHLRPPYRLDDLRLGQSKSSLVIVDLPETNHVEMKSSFKHIGKCVCISVRRSLVSTGGNDFNPLDSKGNYSATSNNTKLLHWPLMGGLLYMVQRGGDWAGPQPAQYDCLWDLKG